MFLNILFYVYIKNLQKYYVNTTKKEVAMRKKNIEVSRSVAPNTEIFILKVTEPKNGVLKYKLFLT